jgi:hypothetical protein
MYNYIVHNLKNNTVHTVLYAPIVIVRAATRFVINLFIYLLFYWYRLQIKWDHKKIKSLLS